MVQHVLPLLPMSLTGTQAATCVVLLIAGAFLWLTGALWSRALVTLIAVTLGGFLGMYLPRWYIWPVNSMSTAVLGAVALGVLAFAIPRMWVGLTLGVVISAWAGLGTWILLKGDAVFETREAWQIEHMILPDYAKDFFGRLPEPVRRVSPYAVGSAMISGLALTLLWPRFGRTLLGGTLGTTLFFGAALTLAAGRHPHWLGHVPAHWQSQVVGLVGFALLGALIQWQFLPVRHHTNIQDEPEGHQSLQAQGR